MPAEKTISISFRVSPKFKALLRQAALKENRSCTNMLETLLFDYCSQHRLPEPRNGVVDSRGEAK